MRYRICPKIYNGFQKVAFARCYVKEFACSETLTIWLREHYVCAFEDYWSEYAVYDTADCCFYERSELLGVGVT